MNKFDVENMINDPSILMIGKSGSGKTHSVHDIIDKLENKYGTFDDFLIISPKEEIRQEYTNKYRSCLVIYVDVFIRITSRRGVFIYT